jgi:dTDP-4-dehydrorhamnose 3,5-epimerase
MLFLFSRLRWATIGESSERLSRPQRSLKQRCPTGSCKTTFPRQKKACCGVFTFSVILMPKESWFPFQVELYSTADIRVGSPTYGQWVSAELTAENGRLMWIPAGFAHGFCVLGDQPATLAYKVTAEYSHAHDGGLVWNDPEIGVTWPISDPILSDKDQKLPLLADCDHGFTFRAR